MYTIYIYIFIYITLLRVDLIIKLKFDMVELNLIGCQNKNCNGTSTFGLKGVFKWDILTFLDTFDLQNRDKVT